MRARWIKQMLDHTSSEITKQHYIEPVETIDPMTAEILESRARFDRRTSDEPGKDSHQASMRLGSAMP
jgi:hypothetical protein